MASHIFFATELEGVATFWRIYRPDGVALGFTSHDRDLFFDGLVHRAAPGMVPSAIRRSARLDDDSIDMQGVLSHSSIASDDIRAGRYDGARIEVGAVDWETLDQTVLYAGSISLLSEEDDTFSARLESAKSAFDIDYIPRTSPTCRAQFCGPGCSLSPAIHTHRAKLVSCDLDASCFSFDVANPGDFNAGEVVWLGGPAAGLRMAVRDVENGTFLLDYTLADEPPSGTAVRLRAGCDHTLATCGNRFGNAVNFQGEPYLPGNDLLARYPQLQ
uniref:DUF2163 domain-containing protein n=1 Tax=Parerythrobacter lutipelagi TaxID=1964208 RepID=UPI0010F6CF28|nr:DUF2163 domain-containing protein [Parerythrobacter lutipelagi]